MISSICFTCSSIHPFGHQGELERPKLQWVGVQIDRWWVHLCACSTELAVMIGCIYVMAAHRELRKKYMFTVKYLFQQWYYIFQAFKLLTSSKDFLCIVGWNILKTYEMINYVKRNSSWPEIHFSLFIFIIWISKTTQFIIFTLL